MSAVRSPEEGAPRNLMALVLCSQTARQQTHEKYISVARKPVALCYSNLS